LAIRINCQTSALFERMLLPMAMAKHRPAADGDVSDLRGVLQGPLAEIGKGEARAARCEERLVKGRK
jgi:hypothetical protein